MEFQHAEESGDGVCLQARDTVADEAIRIHSKFLINCAGLHAHLVAKCIAGLSNIPKVHGQSVPGAGADVQC